MGTRADFYVGRSTDAEWLGSVAWDGYPDGFDTHFYTAKTEAEYRTLIAEVSYEREDWTDASEGWPWPWDTSRTTDYAYAFENGTVYAAWNDYWWPIDSGAAGFGDPFNRIEEEYSYNSPEYLAAVAELEKTLTPVNYPNMKDRAMSFDEQINRSGLIIVTTNGDVK